MLFTQKKRRFTQKLLKKRGIIVELSHTLVLQKVNYRTIKDSERTYIRKRGRGDT